MEFCGLGAGSWAKSLFCVGLLGNSGFSGTGVLNLIYP
jgi:hypothetical protein